MCTQQKLRYLEIAYRCCAISRLCTGAAQSQDCINPVLGINYYIIHDDKLNDPFNYASDSDYYDSTRKANYKARDLYSGSIYTGYCGFNTP